MKLRGQRNRSAKATKDAKCAEGAGILQLDA